MNPPHIWTLAVLTAFASISAPLMAQDTCTYQTCALRLRSAAFGPEIVQGAHEEQLGKIVFLAPAVPEFAERSDSAAIHYGAFRRAHNQGFWLLLSGAALVGTALIIERSDPSQDAWIWGLGIPGISLSVAGVIRSLSGRDRLSRAIWWYNSTLPR